VLAAFALRWYLLHMDRQKLEASATFAALVLLAIVLLGGVVAIADGAFGWDLLNESMERVALFLMGSTCSLLLGCVLVSVMLNLSIIAQKLSEAIDRERNRS
jgi:hypothetical protein